VWDIVDRYSEGLALPIKRINFILVWIVEAAIREVFVV